MILRTMREKATTMMKRIMPCQNSCASWFSNFCTFEISFHIQFTICGNATTRSCLLCGSTDLDKLSLPTTLQSKEEGSLPLGSILHVAAVYLDTRLHQTSIPWRSYLSHVRHRGVFSFFVTVSSVLSNISHLLLLILCQIPLLFLILNKDEDHPPFYPHAPPHPHNGCSTLGGYSEWC